LTFISLKKTTN